jgi:hypothetical protein
MLPRFNLPVFEFRNRILHDFVSCVLGYLAYSLSPSITLYMELKTQDSKHFKSVSYSALKEYGKMTMKIVYESVQGRVCERFEFTISGSCAETEER